MHDLAEQLYETMATCYWEYTAGLVNFEHGLLVISSAGFPVLGALGWGCLGISDISRLTQACPRGISGGGSLSG